MVELLLILTLLAVLVLGVLLFAFNRKAKVSDQDQEISKLMVTFQRELGDMKTSMAKQMLDLSQQMNQQNHQNTEFLQHSHQDYRDAVGKVNKQLGQLHEATASMMGVGKDIASLHDILRAPKLRGGLGEMFLEELLRQILPQENYRLQYGFGDGTMVDAVIFLGEGIISVDAKFPYENFKRILEAENDDLAAQSRKEFRKDVKKHIDAIASKYILPQEGTFEFALMYIPAENIYYETIIKDGGHEETMSTYAMRKKVIPVSPNSFYAYLQAIVRGLRGFRIEKSAQHILESLGQLEADMERILVDFEKMGSHLNHAKSSYDKTNKRFEKFKMKIQSLDSQEKKSITSEPLIPD